MLPDGVDEVRGLYEHAAAAAARIVHSPVVGFDDLDQRLHDARGCVELAGVLASASANLARQYS